jgi:ornithine cyclodeaminase
VIFLSAGDIKNCVTCADAVAAAEKAFLIYESKDFLMPDRMHLDFERNTYLLMPCLGSDYFSTKLVTVYPGNAGSDFPVVDGVVVLNDMRTGSPLAFLNGMIVTALRTGAAAAVSVKYLAPESAGKLGIVGTGAQAFYQVLLTASVRKLTDLTVLDLRRENALAFIEKISAHLPGVEIRLAECAEDLLQSSEIVITATTSDRPVLPECEELLRGKHYVGIGSFKPEAREYPEAMYKLIEKVYIDTEFARKESGDLLFPLKQKWIAEEQIQTLGSYILTDGTTSARAQTTFFKSVGMALFDLVLAQVIYEKAIALKLGTVLTL